LNGIDNDAAPKTATAAPAVVKEPVDDRTVKSRDNGSRPYDKRPSSAGTNVRNADGNSRTAR
jgi:hypothetical protein